MKYSELKEKHQEEIDNFPMYWAFGDKQWKELLEKLNLTEKQAQKELIVGPAGSIMKKDDKEAFINMINKHTEEIQKLIDLDQDGSGFVKDMFKYELINHEFGYTRDIDETLNALNLTYDDIENNDKLLKGLTLAKKEILKIEEQEDEESI